MRRMAAACQTMLVHMSEERRQRLNLPQSQPKPACADKYKMEEGINYSSGDMGGMPKTASSAVSCGSKCQTTIGCM